MKRLLKIVKNDFKLTMVIYLGSITVFSLYWFFTGKCGFDIPFMAFLAVGLPYVLGYAARAKDSTLFDKDFKKRLDMVKEWMDEVKNKQKDFS